MLAKAKLMLVKLGMLVKVNWMFRMFVKVNLMLWMFVKMNWVLGMLVKVNWMLLVVGESELDIIGCWGCW